MFDAKPAQEAAAENASSETENVDAQSVEETPIIDTNIIKDDNQSTNEARNKSDESNAPSAAPLVSQQETLKRGFTRRLLLRGAAAAGVLAAACGGVAAFA